MHACRCHAMCSWQRGPTVPDTFPNADIPPSTFPPAKIQEEASTSTTALCARRDPRAMAMPRSPSQDGPSNAQHCSKRPVFQGHRGLANSQHTFCRICCFLQDPAAGVRGLEKKGCILPLHPVCKDFLVACRLQMAAKEHAKCMLCFHLVFKARLVTCQVLTHEHFASAC